ncbi:MAG TPA: hypothetical protein VMT50_08125 [Steroidobacteraceae bacterium]|nr:hypothetical protein [Steroidobacteraceae bacterium]
MIAFLKVFLDIVLWRRGPQDLPASPLLFRLALAAYVAVSVVQLLVLRESAATWVVFLLIDPPLLTGCVWLVLRLYRHPERFLQTASAVLGTGSLLGLLLYLPLQLLLGALGRGPDAGLYQVAALLLLVVFALVTGRILKLGAESSLATGVGIALGYFFLINLILSVAQSAGG